MSTRSQMIHRTSIERATRTSDTGGGSTESWSVAHSDVHCRAWFVSSRVAVLSDRPGVMDTRFVLMPLALMLEKVIGLHQ